jgi:hypothetical protein
MEDRGLRKEHDFFGNPQNIIHIVSMKIAANVYCISSLTMSTISTLADIINKGFSNKTRIHTRPRIMNIIAVNYISNTKQVAVSKTLAQPTNCL